VDICVIGAGYVGLVTSLCLAYLGNKVVVVESDKNKLVELNKGNVPFYEPGLKELLSELISQRALEFTESIDKGVKAAEIVFIAVGTPSLANGEPDMSQVVNVATAIGGSLDTKRTRIIVNKSTVPVGSGNWVEMLVNQGMKAMQAVPARSAIAQAPKFYVVSNPEFLREGSALLDSFYPDRIVIGANSEESVATMKTLYKSIIEQSFAAPNVAQRPIDCKRVPFVVTDLASAEMIKYSANAFLAMKISFANEIASLCEKVGADIRQVVDGIGFDKRIGRSFLNAGIGWGGSCFGKDVNALIDVANEYNSSTHLLEATIAVNKQQRLSVITKLQEELKIVKGRTISLMGLSFKPNTDDLRDAPSLTIASQLNKMGAHVKAYDPVSMNNCARLYSDLKIEYCHDLLQLADNSDALVLVTEWDEFKNANWIEMAKRMKNKVIIDGRNCLDEARIIQAGFTYKGVGH
jgi:UDPglucose 6-dehydrogenase